MSGSAAVTVRRTSYPQVDPRAAGLMHRALVVVPPRLTVSLAARLAERRRARVVAARVGATWAAASRETLVRALVLGLRQAPVSAVLWDAPLVAAGTSEVAVRRRLGPDRPFVLVGESRRPEGVVLREPDAPAGLPLSVIPELDRLPGRVGEVLGAAGRHGDALGFPVAAVGGLVRDLLLGRVDECTDLDLVVEGNAAAVARELARSLGGQAVEHAAFLTATVVLPDARRIDLATARRESYRAPGALPTVEPAALAEDLGRRDFSLNALAIRLDRAAWGQLVDTTGGLADLRARRIRVLHALSFVEDPTRILRAARLAARLGCKVDQTSRRLAAHAAQLPIYRALSGDRLRAEMELMLAEPRPAAALREAARLGAWGLIGGEVRVGRRVPRLLGAALAPRALDGLGPETPIALALLALADGGRAVETWMDRLALAPARREAIRQARRDAPGLAARVARAREGGAAYRLLQGAPEVTLAWARTHAAGAARRQLDRHLRSGRRLRPLATGEDVGALGVPPGPAVGEILRALRAAQAAGQVRSRPGALRWLKGVVARGRARGRIAHPTG
jgi:tRNA nucleotidyltransferase (CCA-adding enzyme)